QIPIYYNHMNTGRPPGTDPKYSSKYIDLPSTPLFPFGFGLSYTQFSISNLRLNSTTIAIGGSIDCTVDVKNTGQRTGDEVVQLYLHATASSLTRPVKELKGFQRITLAPGQSQ